MKIMNFLILDTAVKEWGIIYCEISPTGSLFVPVWDIFELVLETTNMALENEDG